MLFFYVMISLNTWTTVALNFVGFFYAFRKRNCATSATGVKTSKINLGWVEGRRCLRLRLKYRRCDFIKQGGLLTVSDRNRENKEITYLSLFCEVLSETTYEKKRPPLEAMMGKKSINSLIKCLWTPTNLNTLKHAAFEGKNK